jgi:hypothetical protein
MPLWLQLQICRIATMEEATSIFHLAAKAETCLRSPGQFVETMIAPPFFLC